VERVVDRSLRRLGVERLDLVQLHWWDWSIPGWVEAAGWLDDLRRAGKVRLVGATNFDAERLAEVLDAGVPVVSNQVQHSVIDRRPEGALAALAARPGVALLGYGALAGGFLSERWLGAPELPSPGTAPATALPNRSLTKYKLILQEFGPWSLFQELLETLAAIGRRHRASLATVALRAALDRPATAAAVLGASGARHLGDTLRAFEITLDHQDHAALEAVLARSRGPTGPVYALERDKTGPHASVMRYDLNRV
jgi:aryl-alcohol dehydrogenase-like predicted oxidoreductase